jgi:hypothetical protein
MFPVFPTATSKAVDKGNQKALDNPGDIGGKRPSVGNTAFPAQAMHLLRTPHTPLADSLILQRSPSTTRPSWAFPQPLMPVNRHNQIKLLKNFFPFIFLCSFSTGWKLT